jgi:predicted ATPase/class 3 adenylate cyclase
VPEDNRSQPLLTFLFTDIEGSTSLWEQYPAAMQSALAIHDALLRRAIDAHQGHIFKTVGDAFHAVFSSADDAVAAAVESQRSLHAEKWQGIPGLRVRMALNTGTAEERDGDYFGPVLNRLSRLLVAGHGGQTLLTLSTKDAFQRRPDFIELRDMGERRLKDLSRPEHVFQVVVPDLPSDFPPLATLEAIPNNLPGALTTFVGRESELADVKRLLSTTHLLTLSGSGGCGKTRLSIQVAAELLDTFAGGVWFVELAPISDPDTVPSAVASAMGIREDPSKMILTSIAENLRSKTALLILDNCEHLVGACANIAETLLRACPSLRIVASSREALGIAGETIWRVPSLPEAESIKLFSERARAVAPTFDLTEQNKPSVIQICQRLDGIPLAIELAAARVNVLHVDQIAARLSDRFRLLTGGSRTALPRHRTLRAAIDWSYGLLTDAERKLLRRISVFVAGFTLEAAERASSDADLPAADILDFLTRLVEKSLVLVEETEHEARYSLLDMVRQYSRERLLESGEAEQTGRRHRDFFLALAERAVPELVGPDQIQWLDRLDLEHENFRAALTWCQADPDGIEPSLRLAVALSRFWFVRGYFEEGRMWLKEAMARASGSRRTLEWAKALRGAGTLALMQGDYVSARSLFEECLAIFRELDDRGAMAATLINLANTSQFQSNLGLARSNSEEALSRFRELGAARGIATALSTLCVILHQQGEDARSRMLLQESLRIFRDLKLKEGIAHNLDLLGILASSEGDYVSARSLHEESLAIHRRSGDKPKVVAVLLNLGHAALGQGDIAAAESALREGLQIAQQLGERRRIAIALHNLGWTALKRNDQETARKYLRDALKIREELGDKASIAYSLEGFAAVAIADGRMVLGARLFGRAQSLREAIGAPPEPAERNQYQQLIESVRARLGPGNFEAEWETGRSMPVEDVIAQALA